MSIGRMKAWLLCLLTLSALSAAGCNGGQFPVAPVTGKVLCLGEPVTSGSITFTPIGDGKSVDTGKQASGVIKPDGSFQLSTYGRFDGAIVGKHEVLYVGSEGEESEAPESEDEEKSAAPKAAAKRLAAQCAQSGKIILEVKPGGANDLTIELSSGKK